jgi:hypothetical protein
MRGSSGVLGEAEVDPSRRYLARLRTGSVSVRGAEALRVLTATLVHANPLH